MNFELSFGQTHCKLNFGYIVVYLNEFLAMLNFNELGEVSFGNTKVCLS